MKKLIILNIFFCFSLLKAQVTQQWAVNYNGVLNRSDVGNYTTVDASGNIYVAGTAAGIGSHTDIITIKYNPSGSQMWTAEYGNQLVSFNFPAGIAVDNSGNVYVTGSKYISDEVNHIFLIKYSSSGSQLWVEEFSGPFGGHTDVGEIALDASGNIYIAGDCIGLNFNYDCVILKYNSSGSLQWYKLYNSALSGDDFSNALAIDNSGNIYITGSTESLGGVYYYLTIKYSPNGIQNWASLYIGPGGDDNAFSIAADGNGNSYVTGWSRGSDAYYHIATVSYNPSGAQQWVKRYNGGGNGDDMGIKIVYKGGFVYVGGYKQGVGTGRDYLALKYSTSGNELWEAAYDGPVSGRDELSDIAVDNYGLVYATGMSKGLDGITHMTTVRFNSNGAQQWVQRYNSGQCSGYVDEGAYGIALGPNNGNGVVVVTGGVTHIDNNCSYSDVCTIKYSQTNLAVTPISTNAPENYSLEQNYPNPFNPVTNINFSIVKPELVKLVIFDITGKVVAEPVNNELGTGTYKVDFDASNLASGVYFYRLTAGSFTETKRMSLIK